MKSFLRKKSNNTDKVVFINETDLKPKVRTVFGRCPAHGVLYVFIDITKFPKDCYRVTSLKIFEDGKLLFPKQS